MADVIYFDDVGTAIILDCGSDISSATALQIDVLLPNRSTVTWDAVASGTDSLVYYTEPGDLIPGQYTVQALVTTADGNWRGTAATFLVKERFK